MACCILHCNDSLITDRRSLFVDTNLSKYVILYQSRFPPQNTFKARCLAS